jgi:hypothetical protein
VATRVSTDWELAALAWLALIAVPFAFTDITARRLPDRVTCRRLHRNAHPAGCPRDHRARAGPPRPRAIGAAGRVRFYLAPCYIRSVRWACRRQARSQHGPRAQLGQLADDAAAVAVNVTDRRFMPY